MGSINLSFPLDLTFDLSVIPGAGEVNRLEEKPCDKGAPVSRPEPCQSLMYGNLSTIIEESGSYKSSSTSSASSNSTVPHDSLGQRYVLTPRPVLFTLFMIILL